MWNDKVEDEQKQVYPTWPTIRSLSLRVLFSEIKEYDQGCSVLVSHRFRFLCRAWHSSKHLLALWFFFFPSLSKDQLTLSTPCCRGMCSALCAWWEAHYPPLAWYKPSIFKGNKRGAQSQFPVSTAEPEWWGPQPRTRHSCSFVCLGIMRRAQEEARCATGPGTWLGMLSWVCVHVSPHTGLVFGLGRGLQGPPCHGTNNGVVLPPSQGLARIMLFLSANTTAEMSSLFCNTGICQLGGNKESINWAGDRQRASGTALWAHRKCSSLKLWTLLELPFVFRSVQAGDRGLPCIDHIFSWGHRANSGLFF